MLERIAVHGFIFPAVDGEISLPVTASRFGVRRRTRPGTGSLKIPVTTFIPWKVTSRGSPTFTETSFICIAHSMMRVRGSI